MQASFGSATGRMSKPGKTSSTISKRAGSKRLAYGSAMAIKLCWVRSRRNLGRLPDNAVWFTRWTMCESLIPTKQQEQIKPELRALFYQKDRQAADQAVAAFIEKYQRVYPSAIECLQRDLEACLTFYSEPSEHWKTSRTNNVMERLVGEVKRRSHKMAAAFRNEESCLLLFYAVIRSLKFNNLLNHASDRRLKGWSLDFALSSVRKDSLLAASDLRRGASQW